MLCSDDADALVKTKALVEGAGYPVGATGPLVDARGEEVRLYNNMTKFVRVNYHVYYA